MPIIATTGWTMVAWSQFRSSVNFQTGFKLVDGVNDASDTDCMVTFYCDPSIGSWLVETYNAGGPIKRTIIQETVYDTWYMLAIRCLDIGAGRPRYSYSLNGASYTQFGSAGAGARSFKGIYLYDSMDEVQIYEDTDYAAVDLTALYNAGAPTELTIPYPTTLKYYWKLNNSIIDEIGTQDLILTPNAGSYGTDSRVRI